MRGIWLDDSPAARPSDVKLQDVAVGNCVIPANLAAGDAFATPHPGVPDRFTHSTVHEMGDVGHGVAFADGEWPGHVG